MTKYQKYTWVCTGDCDALIEYTIKDGFGWPSSVMELTCKCGSDCTWVSVEDATIPYTDTPLTTKEETMEETTPAVTVPDTYNANLLVTYKVIRGYSDAEYATDKVASIEWDLHNGRESQKRVSLYLSKIDAVKEIICEKYADSLDQETLQEIAEALDIELIKEIQFTASVEVSGTYSYNILDGEEYDLDSVINDSLYADSNDGNVTIDDTEVCNVRES